MSTSTQQRLLYILKSRGKQTAKEAGTLLDITLQAAQQQFAKLASEELVEPIDRKGSRGRPRRYWQLTAKGHARFPDRHSDLTLDVLTATRNVFGETGLEKLIKHREVTTLKAYRTELEDCTTLEERLSALADIRNREGYMADWKLVSDGEYVLVENHCPICAAAAACQGLCRSELTMFRRLLGRDVAIERTDHILAGARRCAYLIRVR